jgi:hypothetical protein
MPLPLMLGLVSLATAVLTAVIAAISKKWRTPADDREDRKIGIEADELLLARFTKLLEERDKRLDAVTEELKEVRAIAEKAANANRILIDWIYAAVRIVRDLGGIDKLPDPPEGVVIIDHPSYKRGSP